MLLLSRKAGEQIKIGDAIDVTVLQICGSRVRLGFSAPPGGPIHRKSRWAHRRCWKRSAGLTAAPDRMAILT